MRVFRKRMSVFVFASPRFGFEDGTWDLILFIPDHCLSFYSFFSLIFFQELCQLEFSNLVPEKKNKARVCAQLMVFS